MTEIEKALLERPPTHANLATALAAAQGEMKNAVLNKTNPHYRSKYADLASVREATVASLSKHGLAILQYTVLGDGQIKLYTRLLHAGTGEFVEAEWPLPFEPNKPQVMSSAMTYARRITWSAICGIAADEDDDAEATKTNGKPEAKVGDHGGALPDKENWKGPLKITALKQGMSLLARELEACEDYDQFIALMNGKDIKAIIAQCELDLPEWWFGNGAEIKGAKARIEARKKELAALEKA